MRKGFLVFTSIILFIMACTNVRDLNFNGKNHEEIMQKVVDSRSLTDKELLLLKSALQRYLKSDDEPFLSELGLNLKSKPSINIVGKTVGQLIEEEKEVEIRNKKYKKEYKEMLKYLIVSLDKISIREYKSPFGGTDGLADLTFIFENKSTKDIRAFKGMVWVNDLFGDNVEIVPIKYDKGIKPGGKTNVIGHAVSHYKDFKNKQLDNFKLKWQPSAVIFKDGNSLGLEKDK